jgi:hypothetical protein
MICCSGTFDGNKALSFHEEDAEVVYFSGVLQLVSHVQASLNWLLTLLMLLLLLLLLLLQVALDLSKLQEFTGRDKPTVIT